VKSQRPPKKGGPQSEFAWLVDDGVRACQRKQRLPSLEIVQSELAAEIGIGVRTLQSWRANRYPERYEDLRNFAQACLQTAPDLGRPWVIDLFRAAGMSRDIERALSDLQLDPAELPQASTVPDLDQLLQAQIIQPDPIFQRVHLADFVGREWLTAKVDAFLADPQRRSGVFALTGEVGAGKTTFLAQLVQQRNYIQVFGEQVPGPANISRALRSLAAQLLVRYPRLASEHCPTRTGSWPDEPLAFEQLLRAAARGLPPDERLIIVCDALNEVGTIPGGNVLGLPAVLPDGVYLIVSHGLMPIKLSFTLVPQSEWLDVRSSENLCDMQRYLDRIAHCPNIAWWLQAHQQSAAELVDTLLDLSSGNWLYLAHLISEIRRGSRGNHTINGLPASLANYYAAYAVTWRDKDAQKWDILYAPVFVTLVAAREPISLDRLIEWSGVSASRQEVRRLLREDWRPWVAEQHDPIRGTLYTLYHPSLKDFVMGKVDQRGLTITSLHVVDDLQAHLRVVQRRIVEYFHRQCNGDWSQLAGQAYADRHLTYHLEQVQSQGTKPLRDVALAP
jgi:transcriptional regulator with XRE-family HTH domain